MSAQDQLVRLTVALTTGRTDVYDGVFTAVRNEALTVCTVDFLDPADIRPTSPVVAVVSYSMHAVVWWTERPTPGVTPYVILPDVYDDAEVVDDGAA